MLIDISQLKFTKEVNGVIHIGAHECEERMKYLLRFNNVTDNEIIWIDALQYKVNTIRLQNPNIRIFNECISNTDNEDVTFHVTNNLQSSSFLKLKEHLIEHPDIYEIDKIEMKTKSLKTFYNENNFTNNQFNFMALDIQGAELLALKGAGDILDDVDYIYIEVNTKELYENCALLDEVEAYLHTFNFKRQTIYMTEHGWGDAFYVKTAFNLSNTYTIEYGIDTVKIDITDIVLHQGTLKPPTLSAKLSDNGLALEKSEGVKHQQLDMLDMLYIPAGDAARASLFGDPLYGTLKKIFVTSEKIRYIIEPSDCVYIDTKSNKLYINDLIIKNKNKNKNKNKYNLSIMAIFKNETMNLRLWIEHYLWQGVDHFYLIDNGSTDSPLNILLEYIDKGIITYYYRAEKHKQSQHYRYVFDNENVKEKTKWLCICDLDEFFFGTENKLIVSLDEFNNYDAIYTNSYFYGSDNLIDQPTDIRKSIIHRTNDTANGTKYIFKTSSINNSSEIWIHWLVEPGTLTKKMHNEIFTNTTIRLNHYITQSLEYFKTVKMTRGDADVLQNENIRTMDVFNNYTQTATIKDDILKQIVENGYDL